MCRDVDGRQIRVGDYVERVKNVYGFQNVIQIKIHAGMNYSRTNRHLVTLIGDGDYIGVDCETRVEWFSDHFRVIQSRLPQTTREMSNKLLRELNIA